MIRAFTRHARMAHRHAIGTREHFDWSANGDGLREMEPVFAEPVVIVRRVRLPGSWTTPIMALGLCFVLTCIAVQS